MKDLDIRHECIRPIEKITVKILHDVDFNSVFSELIIKQKKKGPKQQQMQINT